MKLMWSALDGPDGFKRWIAHIAIDHALWHFSTIQQVLTIRLKTASPPMKCSDRTDRVNSEWGQIMDDEINTSAILNRVFHHCHPFIIQGDSFRMKNLKS